MPVKCEHRKAVYLFQITPSKVQYAADYCTIDVKMTSKVQPTADYLIIDVKDYWTNDWENLGTRLCHSTKREMAASTVYKFERRKYFEWIIKQLLNSAFVGYDEFCRSRRVLSISALASVDNTLLDLQNSSFPSQPHSIIAKYFYSAFYKERSKALYKIVNLTTLINKKWSKAYHNYYNMYV